MDLAFKLQELSSSLQSLMFELEENPAPTKTIDSIMKRMSRIIKITMDHHWGGLSPHSTLLQAEEKRARNPVPKCPSKLLETAIGR